MKIAKHVASHLIAVLLTYIVCGTWIVICADPLKKWPSLYRLEVSVTWPAMFYTIVMANEGQIKVFGR